MFVILLTSQFADVWHARFLMSMLTEGTFRCLIMPDGHREKYRTPETGLVYIGYSILNNMTWFYFSVLFCFIWSLFKFKLLWYLKRCFNTFTHVFKVQGKYFMFYVMFLELSNLYIYIFILVVNDDVPYTSSQSEAVWSFLMGWNILLWKAAGVMM